MVKHTMRDVSNPVAKIGADVDSKAVNGQSVISHNALAHFLLAAFLLFVGYFLHSSLSNMNVIVVQMAEEIQAELNVLNTMSKDMADLVKDVDEIEDKLGRVELYIIQHPLKE